MNFYNDIEPYACQWIRNLIDAGEIPEGVVDGRSIKDIQPDELRGYKQCHFFSGISGWSLALRLAGVPADFPVWSGSCPCQAFSVAGKQKGFDDERHLWPEFSRIIRGCKPPLVFGEQVKRAIEMGWLDSVFSDLEEAGYSCGAVVLGAHAIGLPHIRQRIFWYAHTDSYHDFRKRISQRSITNTDGWQLRKNEQTWSMGVNQLVSMGVTQRVSPYAEVRRIAHGIPDIVARLKGYGNAIVPQVAAVFIRAFLESAGITFNPDVINMRFCK